MSVFSEAFVVLKSFRFQNEELLITKVILTKKNNLNSLKGRK